MERDITTKQDKFINGRLAKFLLNEYQRAQAISLFKNGVSTAEVFRIISKNKGPGKSHLSGKGYKDGDMLGS